MKNRIIALVSVAVITSFVLTGCGNKKQAKFVLADAPQCSKDQVGTSKQDGSQTVFCRETSMGTRWAPKDFKESSSSGNSASGSSNNSSNAAVQQLESTTLKAAPCSANPLTAFPMNPDEMLNVSPLGNLNPPGHVFPSPHMGLGAKVDTANSTQSQQRFISTAVYAPADLVGEAKIDYQTYTNVPMYGGKTFTDYHMIFLVCGKTFIAFGHVVELSQNLQTALDDAKKAGNGKECFDISNAMSQGSASQCDYYNLKVAFKAGDKIGMSNPYGAGVDFGAMDLNQKTEHADASIYLDPEDAHNLCGLDLLAPALKTKYESLLQPSNLTPKCGSVAQDVRGTAKGNWHVTARDQQFSSSIALVDSNHDGNKQAFSIGSTNIPNLPQNAVYQFAKESTGTTNLDFASAKPGSIYCYEASGNGPQNTPPHVVVIEVSGGTADGTAHLKIAGVSGSSCASAPKTMPSDAATFMR